MVQSAMKDCNDKMCRVYLRGAGDGEDSESNCSINKRSQDTREHFVQVCMSDWSKLLD